ncbi:MAG: diguanylate cyclase [Firmicutes bacterium]|nr:diguanylate cyclase [Bacillota bacterium]
MQLLNNRYKIEGIHVEETNGTVYKVIDLWSGNKKILLKICEKNLANKKIFDFFCNSFLNLTNIKNKYLLQNGKFDILSVVDNKKTTRNQFYYTKEYADGSTLINSSGSLSFEEILDITRQICDLVDYFQFRGITYDFLNPNNIYCIRQSDNINIKVKDIASIYELKIRDEYGENSRSFIAPEFFMGKEKENLRSDIYSIGMILSFLLDRFIKENPDEIMKKEHSIRIIKDLINRMTSKDSNSREANLRLIIESINSISQTNYNLDFKNERNHLNFSTEIIGREKELNEVFKIDEEFENRVYEKKVFSIHGEEGVGKTRLLKELDFLLRMKGRSVYYTTVTDGNTSQLGPIKKILRQMIKNCDSDLIDKYGCELVKIIPELSAVNDIAPSSALSGEREMLRLYDRISNFIVDFIKGRPTYIILDEFHNSDIDTLRLINYFIRNKVNSSLLFIISYNEALIENDKELDSIINKWSSYHKVEEIDLLKFNLQETALMIKNILGLRNMPVKLGARLMNETAGNPRHIEEVIKNFHATGELFIDEIGNWDLKTEIYSNIYIPSNINEAIKRQIDLLENEMYEVAKIISLFRTSVSKGILSNILGLDIEDLDNIIDKLLAIKIIDEKVEDWGYTYDFYNLQTKKYIYHRIEKKEKQELHELISEVLEDVYSDGKRRNIDELVYHLTLSNQTEKAIRYTVDLAKRMEGFVGNVQAISLWQKADELLKDRIDINKLEVLVNLGRLYSFQGLNDKALDQLFKALEGAILLGEERFIVIARNSIADIYLWRNALVEAEEHISQAQDLAKRVNYVEGYIEGARLMNKLYFQKNEYSKILNTTNKYIDTAKQEKLYTHVAHFYNHLGVYYMFHYNIEKARKCFASSIEYFNKAQDFIESTKAINNIGVIYADHYDDLDKSMEYFEKGLNVSQKYNSFENEIVFFINIGETYIQLNQYEKAKEYINSARKLATEIQDEIDLFLINIDLGRIYLNMGDFEKAYKIYKTVKEQFYKQPEQGQNIGEYYDFLSEFNIYIGQWDEALDACQKSIENNNKLKLTLLAESRMLVIKYIKGNVLDKKSINELRASLEHSDLKSIRRFALLEFARISIDSGDIEYARQILNEDEKILSEFTTDYLNIKRNLLLTYFVEDPISELLNIEKNEKNKYLDCDMIINRRLGIEYYKKKNYYQSIYYFVITLDLMHRAIKKISSRDMAMLLLKANNIDRLLEKINFIMGSLAVESYENDITVDIFFEEHFDLADFRELFNKKEFYYAVFAHFNETTLDNIDDLDELVKHFTGSYEDNLDLILKFAMKETFASRGFICIYDREKDKLKILKSSTGNYDMTIINQVISRVKQKESGLLIQSTAKFHKEYVYLEEDIKSLICVPIYKKKRNRESSMSLNDDRRKGCDNFNSGEIVGYIYLDSDRLFNRFDQERFELIEALSYLSFINIDNYNLKKTSSIDMLTGTYTRKYFDILSGEILKKNKKAGLSLAVIMIDIDKFKVVNDTFGHRTGDEVLSKVGDIILDNVRDTDIVGRYGGEEFIIMLPNTSKEDSIKVAEKIRQKIEKAQLLGEEHPLTISLGISILPKHGQYKEELIEKADQALYHAKQNGRNNFVMWSSDIGGSRKRLDRLVGIVSGNTVQDQRNILAMVEIIDLIKEKACKKDKIYRFLGRLIEIVEGKQGALFIIEEDKNISEVFAREIFKEEWINEFRYNGEVINRVVNKGEGEFLIDWEDVENINVLTGTPNWQSIIVTPLIDQGRTKGVLLISVPIKEKEFDYNTYNFVRTVGDIMAAII